MLETVYKGIGIVAKKGDLLEEQCDAIVNPANSQGLMNGGVALAIKQRVGEQVEKDAVSRAPIPIGRAISTSAGGKLKSRFVIHSPTMTYPSEHSNSLNCSKAVQGALLCANELRLETIAFPGMGTGVGRVPKKEAALAMANSVKMWLITYENKRKKIYLKEIRFIAFDDEMYSAFEEAIQKIT